MTDDLYHDLILEHARQSANHGTLSAAALEERVDNPLCGDCIKLFAEHENGVLTRLKFQGNGCAISQAATSMMIDVAKGKSFSEALSAVNQYKKLVLTGEHNSSCCAEQEVNCSDIGDLVVLGGVSKFPARQRCALLICEALERIVNRAKNSVQLFPNSTFSETKKVANAD